jgi:hypothetical protein
MLERCYRRQHPEHYGGEVVEEGFIPSGLRYGPGDTVVSTAPVLEQEPMGAPDAVPLYVSLFTWTNSNKVSSP